MSEKAAWEETFDREIINARAARLAGNEGKARVCARRAAGALIGEYLNRQGLAITKTSAHTRLNQLISFPEISPRVKELANHLLLHVNTEHELPIGIDLIAEVEILRQVLLSN